MSRRNGKCWQNLQLSIYTPFQIFPTQGARPDGNGNLNYMFEIIDLIIYIYKRQFFCWVSHDPREGVWIARYKENF